MRDFLKMCLIIILLSLFMTSIHDIIKFFKDNEIVYCKPVSVNLNEIYINTDLSFSYINNNIVPSLLKDSRDVTGPLNVFQYYYALREPG